jgi:hypothetical protein
MKKLPKKELIKLAKNELKSSIPIINLPSSLHFEIVDEALVEMFECGYRKAEFKFLKENYEIDIQMFGVFILNKVRDAYNKPQNITLVIEDEFKKYKKQYLKKNKDEL